MNPETGEFDMSRYVVGQESLVTHLASETRVDAVLEANIEEVSAKVRRMVATWDGVSEGVGGKGTRTIAKLAIVPAKGHVPASTVVLKLWDAQGRLLWDNRRGLAVLVAQQSMTKFRERPLSEYLQDTAGVQKWLETAFASLPAAAAPEKSIASKPN
jgi:hypothetical protein